MEREYNDGESDLDDSYKWNDVVVSRDQRVTEYSELMLITQWLPTS